MTSILNKLNFLWHNVYTHGFYSGNNPPPPRKKPNKNEIPVLSTTFYKANDLKVNGSNVL